MNEKKVLIAFFYKKCSRCNKKEACLNLMGRFAYMSEMENKNWIYDLIFKNEQKYLNTTKLKS